MRVYGLVPAAGRSERFGGAKLLAKWQDRELLGHVLLKLGGARAAGLVAGTVVVYRDGDDAVRDLAATYRASAVAVPPGGELSLSVRAGLDSLAAHSSGHDREAALVCLADQPLLRLDVIRALVETWSRSPVAAVRPSYRDDPGRPGHPLLLDRSLWPLAAELRGDAGFGALLEARRTPVRTVSVAGANPDVDTPEDLRALDAAESGERSPA
ncbi:MAG: nucleotidyltransferase family protein [Gemmatimonadales bacterium]